MCCTKKYTVETVKLTTQNINDTKKQKKHGKEND